MLIKPHIPTTAYMILGITDEAPNNDSTRLKSKNPIKPQLIAPITVKINVTF